MDGRRRRCCAATAFTLSLAAPGCSTDLDFLAKEPPSAGEDAGLAGSSSVPPTSEGGNHAGPMPGPGERDPEPSGPASLTLLHAVVDAPRLFFCFAGEAGVSGQPLPAGGLGFLESMLVEAIEGFDLAEDLLQPIVLAALPSLIDGHDCGELIELARQHAAEERMPVLQDAGLADAVATPDAGGAPDASMPPAAPAPLRAAALAAIAGGTLSEPRSFLLAATGCIGGRSFTDASERRVCGDSYAPTQPTARAQLVTLSRIGRYDRLALQFFNASLALETAELRSLPPSGSGRITFIADEIVPGQVGPVPPSSSSSLAELGTPLSEAKLAIYEPDQSNATFEAAWIEALARSRVSKLEDGRNYTVVYAGPRPSAPPGAWWNPPAFTLIDNAPLE